MEALGVSLVAVVYMPYRSDMWASHQNYILSSYGHSAPLGFSYTCGFFVFCFLLEAATSSCEHIYINLKVDGTTY